MLLRTFFRRRRASRDVWADRPGRSQPMIESLESRTMLSESASAQLTLVSTTGPASSPVFNYDIKLTNTGTTKIGTFWYAWVPGADLLPSAPISQSSPAGWGPASVTGSANSFDGSAIQWVAQSAGTALSPGQTLSGFDFSTHDSPAALAANSPTHSTIPVETSFVYSGAPFSDTGFQFTATGAPSTSASQSRTSLMTSAATINAGDPVTFTATVTPETPGGAIPTGTVSFMDGNIALGTVAVQSDGTAAFSSSTLPAGTHTITANYNGDGTYAASASAAVTETVAAPPVNNGPALAVSITRSTLPSSLVGGAPAHGVVFVSLTNQSSAAIKGPVAVDVFASADGRVDNSAAMVAQLTRSVNLKPGKTQIVAMPIKSLPANLPNGIFTLLAQATDPSSGIASSTAGPSVRVAAPFIQLSESFTKLTLPSTAVAGARLHASAALRITNDGNIAASGPTTIALFLSSDQTLNGGATPLARLVKSVHILPGKSVMVSIPLTALPAIAPGNYFVVAQVTDPNNQTSSVSSATQISVT